jgi:TnpA family transposase
MSLGCNLTTDRLAKASKNISASSLETTVRNYFNSANLVQANNQVSSLIERISRSGLIPHLDSDQRTASDGQKFKVIFNSIHSTYSGKYFGKDKGITIYSFINNVHNLFYSTVFSASDREAWYVIDGLLHNDVIRSSVHTTDSHGATEPIFAVSYLLGIDFQPRMSHVSQKLMYSMDNLDMNPLEQIGCTIGPPVDERLIEVQWDRILKLLVTFKLKHNLASLVMKRLNSYAVHNPLYRALSELGKLVRTEFLLRYIDEEELRHQIHRQQEKMESAQALSRVVAYGNNGVLNYANQEELQTMEGCKRLITNSIICWNYLYLSRLLLQANESERKVLMRIIPRSSPVAWQHINFHGEFNFEEDSIRDPLEQTLDAIFSF